MLLRQIKYLNLLKKRANALCTMEMHVVQRLPWNTYKQFEISALLLNDLPWIYFSWVT